MGLFRKKKTSVLELISENLSKIDINTFEFIESETNTAGTEIKKYRKKLETKELNIFDTVEILLFPSGEKNIFYKVNLSGLNTTTFKKIVNDLVGIYGKDFTGSGKMDDRELKSLLRDKFWTGRTWENVQPTVSIDAIQDETVQLAILGID